MQPNDQQGYFQPEQPQPAQPVVPQPVGQPFQPTQPTQTTVPQVVPAEPVQQAPVQAEPTNDDGYDDEDGDLSDAPVSWTAHEYIHQEKGAMWFVLFAIIMAALIAVSIFLMNSISFAVLLAVIAVVVVIYSRRPPRELNYAITDDGLMIDEKLHKFEGFKAFGVIHDGLEFSVMLIPVQRFQPGITVYFPEEYGEDIVDMLGSRLPMKDLKLDVVDRIVRMLRL